MRAYIELWVAFLYNADPALGLLLAVVGLSLMFVGWQFHRIAIPFCYFLVGLVLGGLIAEDLGSAMMLGALMGAVLALGSRLLLKPSVALLGGLSGAFILSGYITTFPAVQAPIILLSAAALGFAGGCALAFVMYRETGMLVTAFAGALLLVSGFSSIMPDHMPTLYSTIASFLNDYPSFFAPFLVGGPTLIGMLSQIAAKNRQDVGAV